MSDIQNTVLGLAATHLGLEADKIDVTADFVDLGLDSLDVVEFTMIVEEAFDIELLDAETENLTNMSGFISLVEKKKA